MRRNNSEYPKVKKFSQKMNDAPKQTSAHSDKGRRTAMLPFKDQIASLMEVGANTDRGWH